MATAGMTHASIGASRSNLGLGDARVLQVTPPNAISRTPALNVKSDGPTVVGAVASPAQTNQEAPTMAAPVSRVHGPPQAGRMRRPTSANAHAAIVAMSRTRPINPVRSSVRSGSAVDGDERDPGQEQDEGVGGDPDQHGHARGRRRWPGTIAAMPMSHAQNEQGVTKHRERRIAGHRQVPGEHAEVAAPAIDRAIQ